MTPCRGGSNPSQINSTLYPASQILFNISPLYDTAICTWGHVCWIRFLLFSNGYMKVNEKRKQSTQRSSFNHKQGLGEQPERPASGHRIEREIDSDSAGINLRRSLVRFELLWLWCLFLSFEALQRSLWHHKSTLLWEIVMVYIQDTGHSGNYM